MILLLGKGVMRMGNEVIVKVDRCIMCWLVNCWQQRRGLMHGLSTHTTTTGRQLIFAIFLLTSYTATCIIQTNFNYCIIHYIVLHGVAMVLTV